jgi:hypothetical protein
VLSVVFAEFHRTLAPGGQLPCCRPTSSPNC